MSSPTNCKESAVHVDMAEKCPKLHQEKRPHQECFDDQHRHYHQQHSVSNVLVAMVVIAAASSVCLYVYHVELRVYRLQQRVDALMARPWAPGPRPVAPTSTAHGQRQSSTTTTSTPSRPPSPPTSSVVISSTTTSSSVNNGGQVGRWDWMDWFWKPSPSPSTVENDQDPIWDWWKTSSDKHDILSIDDKFSATSSSSSEKNDQEDKNSDWFKQLETPSTDYNYNYNYNYFDYDTEVGSGLDGLQDDEDAPAEFSGDDEPHTSSVKPNWPFVRRRKRSVDDAWDRPQSDAAPSADPDGGRRQHGRRAGQQRGTSAAADSAGTTRHHGRKTRNERGRRHRKRNHNGRRRNNEGEDADINHEGLQVTGLNAAHFYAPRGPRQHFTSGAVAPATFTFWKAENWTLSQSDVFVPRDDGTVTVLKSGLYLIYAQLVYHDLSGRWSFGVYVGDKERIKCMNTEQMRRHRHGQTNDETSSAASSSSHGVYQHCYTSAVLSLIKYDTLSIRCLYGSRAVVMQPEFTFWGLVRLASTPD